MTVLELCGGGDVCVDVVIRGARVRAFAPTDAEEQRLINACPRPVIPRDAHDHAREAAEREWRADCAALLCAASLRLGWSAGKPYTPACSAAELDAWVLGVLRVDALRGRISGPEIDGVNAAWRRAVAVSTIDAERDAKKD